MVDFTFVGRGLYSIPEASRLTGVPAKRIRRWNRGYDYWDLRGRKHHSDPVLQSDVPPPSAEVQTIFFADLIETRIVNELRNQGVSWTTIKDFAEAARRQLRTAHPFASKKFCTDGKEIFLKLRGQRVMNVRTKQLEWRRILDLMLHDLVYDAAGNTTEWWPMGKGRRVVIDPMRAFGSPIVLERIPTWVLDAAARAEGSAKQAAWAYRVPEKSVRDAVAFERQYGLRRRV